MVKLLRESGGDVNYRLHGRLNTPLSIAIRNDHLRVVKYLLKEGASLDGALHTAIIYSADIDFVKVILSDSRMTLKLIETETEQIDLKPQIKTIIEDKIKELTSISTSSPFNKFIPFKLNL